MNTDISVHGGDIYSHPGVLDFSVSLSPLGMPTAVREAAMAAVDECTAYPDIQSRQLRQVMADRLGLNAEQILCSAGATELIHSLCAALRPKYGAVFAPAFSEYERALLKCGAGLSFFIDRTFRQSLSGDVSSKGTGQTHLGAGEGDENCRKAAQVRSGTETENGRIRGDAARINGAKQEDDNREKPAHPRHAARTENDRGRGDAARNYDVKTGDIETGSLVFFCNPANPSGFLTEIDFIEELCIMCAKRESILAVDESFMPFVADRERYSASGLLKRHKNLVVIGSFTKMFSMPGIRLGYGLFADSVLAHRIGECMLPWSLSQIAQRTGMAAMGLEGWREEVISYVKKERNFLQNELTGKVRRIYESSVNYILFEDEPGLYDRLMDKGIMIRKCDDFRGLKEGFYRVGIRRHEDNVRLIRAMKEG